MIKEKSRDVARKTRLIDLACSLPEVEADAGQHVRFHVGRRVFAYYEFDHHGDGRVSLVAKASPGDQAARCKADPGLYFVPKYLGTKGWVGIRLDQSKMDWAAVEAVLVTAYRLVAPRTLLKQLQAPDVD